MTTPPLAEPQRPPSKPTLAQRLYGLETPCIGCGYNLIFARVEGQCPECGRSVAESIRLTRYCDPFWLLTMRFAAWLFGFLLIVLLSVVIIDIITDIAAFSVDYLSDLTELFCWWAWYFGLTAATSSWPPGVYTKPRLSIFILRAVALIAALAYTVIVIEPLSKIVLLTWFQSNVWNYRAQSMIDQLQGLPGAPLILSILRFSSCLLFVTMQARLLAICAAIIGARRLAAMSRYWVTFLLVFAIAALVLQITLGSILLNATGGTNWRWLLWLAIMKAPMMLAFTVTLVLWFLLSSRMRRQYSHSRAAWESKHSIEELAGDALVESSEAR